MILTKELWAVTPSFEQQDDDDDSRLDDVPDAELVVNSGSDSDSDSESDDDERLSVVRDKHQKSMQKFWMQGMKPLPKEKEEEYAARIQMLVARGSSLRHRRRKGLEAPPHCR